MTHTPTLRVLATGWLGLACTSTGAPPHTAGDDASAAAASAAAHGEVAPAAPAPACPKGTALRRGGGDGPHASDWWCARGDVRHGPFGRQDFDERSRTWYEIRGEHGDGELHGVVVAEGFYDVAHSGRSRVFRRQQFEHGRVVRSNEAEWAAVLADATPVLTRRVRVKAAGLRPTAQWDGERNSIGTFDLEVSATWSDATADAPPRVLRVELAAPSLPPARADLLLHPVADDAPPATASSLPFGYAPTVSVPWHDCDPAGCEVELVVTLRAIVPGPGQVQTHAAVRAVPETWPAAATLEVRALEP